MPPENDSSFEARVASSSGPPSPDVSVLVPSFNSGQFIAPAIQSALNQLGFSVEVLVQDGGSTDGTQAVLADVDDDRVHVIYEKDGGQADALNRALARARGEFILWLNADDLLRPNSVGVLLDAARSNGHDIVYGDFDIIDEHGDVIKPYKSAPLDRRRLFRYGVYIFSGSVLLRRRFLEEIGGFNAALHYCMDYELYLRVAAAGASQLHVPLTVGQFRRQPESKTETGWRPFAAEQYAVARQHGAGVAEAVRAYVRYSGYNWLRPIFRSRLWLRLRPTKRLGGV